MSQKSHKDKKTCTTPKSPVTNEKNGIAVIGMACRFPGGRDYEQFWRNLEAGVNGIVEIPKDRWDWRDYFGDPQTAPNKTNNKWGGFIEDIDKFDAAFFRISPREAVLMDPQQRLMLELARVCIEDAGLNPSTLAGSRTGVFIGICNYDYKELLDKYGTDFEGHSLTGTANTIVPNRISYYYDLKGPSVSIDTACSSSLIAIHEAVQALKSPACALALVGGINILCSPDRYIPFSKLGMLSSTGRCWTFDAQANGYVRGEGAGLVLLKPLSKAITDNDHIYGVIKSSCVNHGGRAHTLTSPNAYAQSKLIVDAYTKANIPPNTVTYIETHGTGTPLGDPIEINGLLRAFKKLYRQYGMKNPSSAHCGLGAVKTNIGHLEGAAGIAGVMKILLAMRYKKLPAHQNFSTLNPRISLKESPFYIVQETKEWKTLPDTQGKEILRRAGVSSFGFGGANAHVVIEEYIKKAEDRRQKAEGARGPYLIVLSAKNEDRLREMANNLHEFINNQNLNLKSETLNLNDLAYTLQTGREAMEERLTLVAKNETDLLSTLLGYLEGKPNGETVYSGNVKATQKLTSFLIDGEEGDGFVNSIIKKRNFVKLAQLWGSGLEIDWDIFYKDCKPQRISLPAYPFARDRYWISESLSLPPSLKSSWLHPMLHKNTSCLYQHRYTSTFTGDELFMTKYDLGSRELIPGLFYLEMAREAGELSTEQSIRGLRNMVWGLPFNKTNGSRQDFDLSLHKTDTDIVYKVNIKGQHTVAHHLGEIILDSSDISWPEQADFSAIRSRLEPSRSDLAFRKFMEPLTQGVDISVETIQEVYLGKTELLATLSLPNSVNNPLRKMLFQPVYMNASWHLLLFFSRYRLKGALQGNSESLFPFSLKQIAVDGSLSEQTVVHLIQETKGAKQDGKYDITFYDLKGKPRMYLKSFTGRRMDRLIGIRL